jgi:hypothetical protein
MLRSPSGERRLVHALSLPFLIRKREPGRPARLIMPTRCFRRKIECPGSQPSSGRRTAFARQRGDLPKSRRGSIHAGETVLGALFYRITLLFSFVTLGKNKPNANMLPQCCEREIGAFFQCRISRSSDERQCPCWDHIMCCPSSLVVAPTGYDFERPPCGALK